MATGLTSLIFSAAVLAGAALSAPPRPHLIVILADDLGYADVGWNGGTIPTPHLDRLAASGARIDRHYTSPVCTPTRASLLTGRYPSRYGLQTGVIWPWDAHGLSLAERTLPQALKEAGYRTALVGKWHLGHATAAQRPNARGFDHAYGCLNGWVDYFTRSCEGSLDWHRNGAPLKEEGYTTDLIAAEAVRVIAAHDPATPLFLYLPFTAPHSPLMAPESSIRKFPKIADPKRRTYAAMVRHLDDGVGRVLAALKKRGMEQHALVLFSGDNGGPTDKGADNGPLKGRKGNLKEGGIRAVACVAWPGKIRPGASITAPVHVTDWYPTFLRLAGAPLEQPLSVDGLDIGGLLAGGPAPVRADLLLHAETRRGAILKDNWKLILNEEGAQLYDLSTDPYESVDRAAAEPDRVKDLTARIETYRRAMVPALGVFGLPPTPAGWHAPATWSEVHPAVTEGAPMNAAPRIETRAAQPYVFIACDAPDGDVGAVAPPLIGELAAWLSARGAAPAGPPFFNYVRMGKDMHLWIEVAFPVSGGLAGNGRIAAGVLPAGRYAVLRHTGPYTGLRDANRRLYDWGARQGLRWEGRDGPDGTRCRARLESYLTDPAVEKNPEKFETDVVFLIAD